MAQDRQPHLWKAQHVRQERSINPIVMYYLMISSPPFPNAHVVKLKFPTFERNFSSHSPYLSDLAYLRRYYRNHNHGFIPQRWRG